MTYHSLSECTLTPDERADEARNIVENMLCSVLDECFTTSELKFINGLKDADFAYVSVKQLFWLRDIKDKYL